MNSIEFIAKHLDAAKLPTLEPCDTICLFTGKQIKQGISVKKAISANFTDHEYLKYDSGYVSPEAWLCIGSVIHGKTRLNSLRSYSYIVTESELKLLKHTELIDYILNPPNPPFVFVISYNNKKHTSFKADVNHSKELFQITTDLYSVQFDKKNVNCIYPIVQKWYSVIPEKQNTELQPTWFTKKEIKVGCINNKKIREYGINKYFKETQMIEKYRNTNFLELLIHCLRKDG